MKRLLIVLVAVAVFSSLIAWSSTASAGCWPHYSLSQNVLTQPIQGGGTATAKAQVRGFIYPVACLVCVHGESNSNTSVTVDNIVAYGEFYKNYAQVDWGIFQCTNCTGGYWKSMAVWTDVPPFNYPISTYAAHGFIKGGWGWNPYHWSTWMFTCVPTP